MSEISETEIKSMTKEQNYMRGYEDGKSDVLDKIRAEIEQKARPNEIGGRGSGKSIRYGLCMALQIIDKYKAEIEPQNTVEAWKKPDPQESEEQDADGY